MSNLYERLEEIQEIVRVLGKDVKSLREVLGSRSIQDATSEGEYANRRFYIRAIFALVEAIVEQHKGLLLDLAEHHHVTLEPGVAEVLSERTHFAKDNGDISVREQYLQIERKIRTVYKAAGAAFSQPLEIDFGNQGWASFRKALDMRDRITHPKSSMECQIDGSDLDTVDQADAWFKTLNSEFVRIAGAHRSAHHWGS